MRLRSRHLISCLSRPTRRSSRRCRYRGRPNSPYLVPLTVRAIATLKGVSEDDVAAAVTVDGGARLRLGVSAAAPDGLLSPTDVRRLVAALGLRPTKTLGQNFVIDPNTVRRIVRTADLGADDVVVEVGPGLGSLTLGACCPVVCSGSRRRDRPGAGWRAVADGRAPAARRWPTGWRWSRRTR